MEENVHAESFSQTDWDRYAQWYDCLNDLIPYAQMLESIAAIVRGSGVRNMLDAGCGTGNLITRLMRSAGSSVHETFRVTAVDSSPAMLERAQAKGGTADYRQADLDAALPFDDGAFECITCINALYAAVDPRRTLREFYRTLRRGGMLIIATPRQGYQNGLILKAHCASAKPDEYWMDMHESPEREELLLHEAFGDSPIFRQMHWIAQVNRQIARNRQFHFFTDESLCDLASAAGFSSIGCRATYAGENILMTARKD